MRYDPSDYLYASARIRALESRLVGRDKLNQLSEASCADEILGSLAENGFDRTADPLRSPDMVLKNAFCTVADAVPDKGLIRFLQYPYDCHNLKTVIKCRIKGIDPAPLLSELGSIPTRSLLTGNEKALAELLPKQLLAAYTEAYHAYLKTGDPREIDFILDRALYTDMWEAVRHIPFAADWLAARIDLSNLLICLRLLRVSGGELGKSTLDAALLPCGRLARTQLLQCYGGGEDQLFSMLSDPPYGGIWKKEQELSVLERQADNYLMHLIRRAKSVVFGVEVPLAYLLATEAQCKNIRILLAGKQAGLDPDAIRERMRDCYV